MDERYQCAFSATTTDRHGNSLTRSTDFILTSSLDLINRSSPLATCCPARACTTARLPPRPRRPCRIRPCRCSRSVSCPRPVPGPPGNTSAPGWWSAANSRTWCCFSRPAKRRVVIRGLYARCRPAGEAGRSGATRQFPAFPN